MFQLSSLHHFQLTNFFRKGLSSRFAKGRNEETSYVRELDKNVEIIIRYIRIFCGQMLL